jgi:hypothetical protein
MAILAGAVSEMSLDTDAAAYITAVETADAASLPNNIKFAINNFVIGAKADGFWSAIKAACFLAGPATLNGALVPLVGPAPTNVGGLFVSGDYNQLTGLKGNGTSKYLNTNRNNNADGQNNNHRCVYVTESGAIGSVAGHMGTSIDNAGCSNLGYASNNIAGLFFRNNAQTAFAISNDTRNALGIWGTSRSASGTFAARVRQNNNTASVASETPESANHLIWWRGSGNYSAARFSWYSVGDSLDLAALEGRLATYMTAIATTLTPSRRRRSRSGGGVL